MLLMGFLSTIIFCLSLLGYIQN
uniref:Uncharacterized protein n=1 Tax=Anguilla anguilla TaxID=7936 RepID=A0A0E9PM46_ANGAN